METKKLIKLNKLNKFEMSAILGGASDSGIVFCSCPCCCCCDENTNKAVQKARDNQNTCRCNDKAVVHSRPPQNEV